MPGGKYSVNVSLFQERVVGIISSFILFGAFVYWQAKRLFPQFRDSADDEKLIGLIFLPFVFYLGSLGLINLVNRGLDNSPPIEIQSSVLNWSQKFSKGEGQYWCIVKSWRGEGVERLLFFEGELNDFGYGPTMVRFNVHSGFLSIPWVDNKRLSARRA